MAAVGQGTIEEAVLAKVVTGFQVPKCAVETAPTFVLFLFIFTFIQSLPVVRKLFNFLLLIFENELERPYLLLFIYLF